MFLKNAQHFGLAQYGHIHFIGIGGIGISALAKMMHYKGVRISGTNDSESPETLDELQRARVPIQIATTSGTLPEDADAFVYSVAWENRAPQVLEAARKSGKPVLNYFEALGEIAKEYKTIAISGTHGKTTTTAMIAQILIYAELDPTVVVGSLVDFPSTGSGQVPARSNFRGGEGEYLVVEACEYKRHFTQFSPHIFGITNVELDHPDYYKDLSDVQDAFRTVALQSETVVCDVEASNVTKIIEGVEASIIDYQKYLDAVPALHLLGEHNKHNAALALAVADTVGIRVDIAEEALEKFRGSWRRMEYKGTTEKGAKVYDDYAHHPTEIRATLKAIHEEYPGKRVVAVFEPHMFSRTKVLFKEFGKAFENADKVVIAPIYAAREPDDGTMSAEILAQEVAKHHTDVRAASTLEEATSLGDKLAENENDVLVFMSAGDIYMHISNIITGN